MILCKTARRSASSRWLDSNLAASAPPGRVINPCNQSSSPSVVLWVSPHHCLHPSGRNRWHGYVRRFGFYVKLLSIIPSPSFRAGGCLLAYVSPSVQIKYCSLSTHHPCNSLLCFLSAFTTSATSKRRRLPTLIEGMTPLATKLSIVRGDKDKAFATPILLLNTGVTIHPANSSTRSAPPCNYYSRRIQEILVIETTLETESGCSPQYADASCSITSAR